MAFSHGGLERLFDPVWDMVLEHSTGYSGAFARQVTLNQQSVGDTITLDLLTALEQSAREDVVILKSHGAFIRGDTVHPCICVMTRVVTEMTLSTLIATHLLRKPLPERSLAQ